MINRLTLALVVLASSVLAQASDTQQYCNEMYPADSYDPSDRSLYVQECMDAYADSAEAEPVEVMDEPEEVPYYEGTVEEYIEEQPVPDEYTQ